MASIRRTLSPYHQNGGVGNTSPFSLNSPTTSHKHTQTSRFASLIEKPRKGSLRTWRRSIYTCLLFFLAGFLLGLAPFGQFDQQQDADFSFETLNRPPPLDTTNILVNKVALAVETKDENSENKDYRFDYIARKQLIVVTPTYNRALQAFYLNRLGHVLRLVPPPVLWIVVEMNVASTETADILRGMGIMYRHLVCGKNLTDVKDRGVHQRNTALEHIEHHKLDGIVYFADDDNVYSLELFETLRDISRFGTWPVAMVAQSKNKATLEGPVCNGSQVIGWHTNEKSKRLRRFHVDMSGFAFNSTILWDPKRWGKRSSALIRQMDTVKEGFQETTFIEQLVEDESQMEATPSGCSKIMNWHLHLEAHGLAYPKGWLLQKNLDAVLPIE